MDTKYNGWTNYETWNVALWFDNNQGTYSFWTEQAQACFNDAEANKTFTKAERAKLALSKQMQAEVEENTPTVTGMYADLLNASLGSVNWYEVAEHYIDEVDKEEDAA